MELYVALFLFFIGTGASTISVSSYYVVRNRIEDLSYFNFVKYSVVFGTTFLLIGIFTILYELIYTHFELNSFGKLLFHFVTSSCMDYLVISISMIIPIAILYILSFSPFFKIEKRRVLLAQINFVLSFVICILTAFLINGAMGHFVWNNILLMIIFFVSSLCSGVAIVLFLRSVILKEKLNSQMLMNFPKINICLLLFGFMSILTFAFVLSLISISEESLYILRLSSIIGKLWWFGVVGVGFIVPLCICVISVFRPLSCFVEYVMFASVLFGAFCLKYTILLAGYLN